MYISRNLTYVILTSVFVLFGQSIIGSDFGITEAMQASYKDLQADVFMKSWLLLGPIPVFPEKAEPQGIESQKKAFATDFLTQCEGESGVIHKPDMVYQINGKEFKWQAFESKDGIVDLTKVYGNREYVVAYAWTEIDSPEAKDVLLGVGSDDAIKVWLNGKLIDENWITRGVNKDDDIISAKLQKGKNQILLKIQNMQMGWGFCCRILGKESLTERLISTAGKGDLDGIEMLLSYGADVNSINDLGLTALYKAQMSGRKDAVDLLLKNGADPNIKMPDKEALADAVFNRVIKGDSPGAAVIVSKDGKIIYQKGFGYADVEKHIPITVDTKFRTGSITKQFTASAILKLQEEGKLSVNDKLSKFIPDFNRGDEVTIHHLLTHTSGIPDYMGKPDFDKTVAPGAKPEEIINFFKNDKLVFNPGDNWSYSNSGYFILGYIVEKVSGQPLDDYLKSSLVNSLGMKNTGILTSKLSLEQEANGYSYENGKFEKVPNGDMSRAGGAGSLYSTVADLYLWNEGIFNGKALNESSLKSAFTPVILNNGKNARARYGYGWSIGEDRSLRLISHNGGILGFNSDLKRYTDINATVVALQNCLPSPPGMTAGDFTSQLFEIFFWELMKPQESFKVDETVNSSIYDAYVGKYDCIEVILNIIKEDDHLFVQLGPLAKFEIFPKSESEFFRKSLDSRIKFVKNEKGEVTHAIYYQDGIEINASRLKDEVLAEIDPAIYDLYVGEYQFPQATYKVMRDKDGIYTQIEGYKISLLPKSESEFFSDAINLTFRFVKDDQGKVTKMVINQAGTEDEGIRKK